MATKTTTVDKADASTDDHQRADRASDAFMVGIDTDGREHYYSRIRDCMTVRDGDEHQTQPLDGRPLKDWLAFVDQELCGWSETNVYSGSTFRHLGQRVDEAVTEADQ